MIYRPLVTEAVAFAEGSLIIPVRPIRQADQTENTDSLPVLERANGATIPGKLRFLSIRPRRADEQSKTFSWARSDLVYEEITPGDDAENTATQAFFVFNVPEPLDGETVDVAGSPVLLRVLNPGAAGVSSFADWVDGPQWAWPEVGSPMEAFRRRLLWEQSKLEARAGHAPDELLKILARDNAMRWGAGLQRLGTISPAVAATLTEILTRTSEDGPTTFAAWPVDPGALAELEARLLAPIQFAREKRDLTTWALTWAEEQPQSIAWIESDHGAEVRLAIANLTTDRLVAEVRWNGTDEPPIAVIIGPQSIEHFTQPRPAEAGVRTLRIQAGNRTWYLPTDPAVSPVHPPGATIGSFTPMWHQKSWLDGVTGRRPPTSQVSPTKAILRPGTNPEQWELFIECAGPGLASNDTENDESKLAEIDDWDELAGTEAITVFVGPMGFPEAVFTITPAGILREWMGTQTMPTLIASRRNPGGWLCRVTLPKAWTKNGTIDLGFMRTHHQNTQAEQFPRPSLPWKVDPGRARYDLTAWNPLALPR